MRTHVISTLKANRLLKSRCESYLVFISEDRKKLVLEEIPVVRDFSDVFPNKVPSLLIVQDVDFTI